MVFLSNALGPDRVLLVSSTQTVVEFTPSAGASTICNMEIKVWICIHQHSSNQYIIQVPEYFLLQ